MVRGVVRGGPAGPRQLTAMDMYTTRENRAFQLRVNVRVSSWREVKYLKSLKRRNIRMILRARSAETAAELFECLRPMAA